MTPLVDLASERSSSGTPAPGVVAWYTEGFSDRLGDRLLLFDNAGPALELLRLNAELVTVEGFEAALRARVEELKHFRHPAFARVRAIKWLDDPQPQLALVSEHVPGERLSRVLRLARMRGLRPGPEAVVWLLRQLVPALAALQEHQGLSHGLLSPDRIIVTSGGELAIADYALGSAIERQRLTPFELWQRYGVAVLPGPGRSAFDPQGDVQQVARLALSMLAGRPLRTHGSPESVEELLEQAPEPLAGPGERPLRAWLAQALAIEAPPFRTAREAHLALESMLLRAHGAWPARLLPGTVESADESGSEPPPSSPSDTQPVTSGQPDVSPPFLASVRETVRPLETRRGTRPARLASVTPTAAGRWAEAVFSRSPIETKVRRLQFLSGGLAALALVEALLLVAVGRDRQVRAEFPATAVSTQLAARHEAEPTTKPPQAPPRSVVGWLTVKSDVEVRVYANGRLLGSGSATTFRLPAGEHKITLVNESAGVRTTQSVRIIPGQIVAITRLPSDR